MSCTELSRRARRSALVAALVVTSGCGEPTPRELSIGETQRSAAIAWIEALHQLHGRDARGLGPDGAMAAAAQLVGQLGLLLQPVGGPGLDALPPPMSTAERAGRGGDDCATMADGITIFDCATAWGSIAGFIAVTGDETSFELVVELTAVLDLTIATTGLIVVTESTLTGHVDTSLVMSPDAVAIEITTATDYDVVLTDGCPTGGSAVVDASWTVDGEAASSAITVAFGPECGEVALFVG
jgi:hypothetical protein